MKDFDRKIITFTSALMDVYKDEDDREMSMVTPLELKEENLTDDFTAMFYAQWLFYRQLTGDDVDILGFINICNRLVFQKMMKEQKGEK